MTASTASTGAADLVARLHRLGERATDLTGMRAGIDRLLRGAIGYDFAAISTVDPATLLWTSCFVSGIDQAGSAERERALFDAEFHHDDVNSFTSLLRADRPVGRLHEATGGDLTRAVRHRTLLGPLDVADEMRIALRSRDTCWGTICLYRAGPAAPFSPHDEQLAARAAGVIADLLRLAMLRVALDLPHTLERPPGLLIVTPAGEPIVTTAAADAWLDSIDDRQRVPSVVRSVAAAAAAGDSLARASLPARDGRWVVFHGSALLDPADPADRLAIVVEEARPIELSEVIAEAYGLTAREREVTALAAQGRSSKQMAQAMDISVFTVQDHLKAIYAKTGVQRRGELVATIFAQHYEPRNDAGQRPSPYGWYLDDGTGAA